MRGIQTPEYLYLYNPWSDGERKFATATTSTATYRQMKKRAVSEPDVAARVKLFDHRVIHELYDVRTDPDCLVNLADSAEHADVLTKLQAKLADELDRIEDPVAPLLHSPTNDELRVAYMTLQDKRSADAKRKRAAERAAQRARAAGKVKRQKQLAK